MDISEYLQPNYGNFHSLPFFALIAIAICKFFSSCYRWFSCFSIIYTHTHVYMPIKISWNVTFAKGDEEFVIN